MTMRLIPSEIDRLRKNLQEKVPGCPTCRQGTLQISPVLYQISEFSELMFDAGNKKRIFLVACEACRAVLLFEYEYQR